MVGLPSSQNMASSVTVDAIKTVTDNLPDSGALTSISDVTDLIPNAGAMTSISDETDKIDSAASDGLGGTSNSMTYRIHEAERHLHSYERWFETAAAASGEVHVADAIGSGSGAFQIDAGNDTWGSWLQVLGSSDTPAITGSVKYDPHKVQIDAAERTATYFIQFAFGTSGAAALTAGTYTEFTFTPQAVAGRPAAIAIGARRHDVGTKAWMRTKCPGQNTATLDFYVGLHEYEG